MFYEPEEDSHLMVECIKNLKHDSVQSALDVGTGSGILAQALCESYPGAKVIGIDINDEALAHAKSTVMGNFDARKSDLFENVTEEFDVIVCNPPYLPQNKLDDMSDVYTHALIGGKRGYEYIIRFLDEVHLYMKQGCKVLLLFSNLSNKDHIDHYVLNSMYEYTQIAKKHVGMMEDLYIYELTLPDVVHALKNPEFVSRGKRGMIVKGGLNEQIVCAKIPQDKLYGERMILKEVTFLKRANKLGIGPKYISHTKDYVLMEFVEGVIWQHWVKTASKKDIRCVLADVMKQCELLDSENMTKQEMTNPTKHIIIRPKGSACLLDFERTTITNRGKNVGQFEQFCRKFE